MPPNVCSARGTGSVERSSKSRAEKERTHLGNSTPMAKTESAMTMRVSSSVSSSVW